MICGILEANDELPTQRLAPTHSTLRDAVIALRPFILVIYIEQSCD